MWLFNDCLKQFDVFFEFKVKNEKNLASSKLLKDNNSADVSNVDIEECGKSFCRDCIVIAF